MSTYYFSRTLEEPMETAEKRVVEALKANGFGVLTEIDVKATLKKKIDADFRPYKILGACNPRMAHQALLAEDKIGLMLPCNVILQQTDDGHTEVAAVDPVASMQAVENPNLSQIATQVRDSLRQIIASL